MPGGLLSSLLGNVRSAFGGAPAYRWEDAYQDSARYWSTRSFYLSKSLRDSEKENALLRAELAALVAAVNDLRSALDTARRGD
jgi:hypothetical protein